MHRTTPLVLLAIGAFAFAACQQRPTSVLGPTGVAVGASTTQFDEAAEELAGAITQGDHHSAEQDSDFGCRFPFRFGVAEQSHATRSASGNQTLVCTGQATPPGGVPDRAVIFEGFPCGLRFDNGITTDSRLVLTPSGHATMTCQSKT